MQKKRSREGAEWEGSNPISWSRVFLQSSVLHLFKVMDYFKNLINTFNSPSGNDHIKIDANIYILFRGLCTCIAYSWIPGRAPGGS